MTMPNTTPAATSTKAAVTTRAALHGLDAKTPAELFDLQDEWAADKVEAVRNLKALGDHLRERYGARIEAAYDRAGKTHGTVWADAGGGFVIEAEADRSVVWNQDQLRALVAASPELLDQVRIDVPAAVLAQLPDALRAAAEAAMTIRPTTPRVALHPLNP